MTAALYGLLACALLAGAAASFLPYGRRLPLALGSAGLALTPLFGGESLAMWLHGTLGAPSLTLVQLAVWRLAAPHCPSPLAPAAALAFLALALIFYPLALGWGSFDPYALGYQPASLLAALVPLAAWLARRRQDAWLTILACDLLAYAAGIFGNLWEAFFDPLLAALALAVLLRAWLRGRRQRGG